MYTAGLSKKTFDAAIYGLLPFLFKWPSSWMALRFVLASNTGGSVLISFLLEQIMAISWYYWFVGESHDSLHSTQELYRFSSVCSALSNESQRLVG